MKSRKGIPRKPFISEVGYNWVGFFIFAEIPEILKKKC